MEALSFERDHIRVRVEKRIEALQKGYRQNIGILGPRGYGKTHLLGTIFESLVAHPSLLVISVRAEALNFDHFSERWIGSVLTSLFLNQHLPLPSDLQSLVDCAVSQVPKTVEKIHHIKKMIRKGERNAASVRELFTLTGMIAQETGKKVLLMIDEFQALEYLPATDPFALLGREIMVEKETLYLVTSSKPEKAREIFHDKLSLLFGNFEVIELAPLGLTETQEFMRKKQPRFVFSEPQKRFLIRMTDGIPAYLELLLDQLGVCFPVSHSGWEERSSQGGVFEIPTERLLVAFHRELYCDRGRLALIFEKRLQSCKRLAKDSSPYIHALLAISAGRRKVLSIATYIGRNVKETKKILERLAAEEIIVKRGSFYTIGDYLFRFWLREVFLRRQGLYSPKETQAIEAVAGAFQNAFEQVQQESDLDISSRVETLFKEFRNDLIEINWRRWRCPQFSEVTFRPSDGRLFSFVARSVKGRWVCQLALQSIREEDVSSFFEDLKRYRKNVQRRILIPLAGIDQNAKLIAQEAKIQIWDIRSFNELLDLYNLPKIIVAKESCEQNLGTMAQAVHSS